MSRGPRPRTAEWPRRGGVARAALAAAILAGGAVVGCSRGGQPEKTTEQTRAPAATPAPVSVTARTVEIRPVERTVDFVGTLDAQAEALVASEVEGRLLTVSADLGDHVDKGQVLASLDDSELRAKLREAEASATRANLDEARARRLKEQGVIAQQEFDALTSAQNVAQSRRDVLAIQLGHTQIRAPFAGSVAKRLVDVGNWVNKGTPLFQIVADNPLRLRGEVPERYASEIAIGQSVRGIVEALSGKPVLGRLTRISAAANPVNRAFTVEVEVPNSDGQLKPGFFCKAQIVTRSDADAMLVPVDALIQFAGVTRVFVIDATSTARGREITVGQRLGTMVEVTAGLKPGERIATSGLARLIDGASVTVREDRPEPGASPDGAVSGATPDRGPGGAGS